jgi:hypothetical protein
MTSRPSNPPIPQYPPGFSAGYCGDNPLLRRNCHGKQCYIVAEASKALTSPTSMSARCTTSIWHLSTPQMLRRANRALAIHAVP